MSTSKISMNIKASTNQKFLPVKVLHTYVFCKGIIFHSSANKSEFEFKCRRALRVVRDRGVTSLGVT